MYTLHSNPVSTKRQNDDEEHTKWRIQFTAGSLIAAHMELEKQGFDDAAEFIEVAIKLIAMEVNKRSKFPIS